MESSHHGFGHLVDRFKSTNSSSTVPHYSSYCYQGSPADSGVMSPMTPVSSLTGSTPEHLTGFQSSPFPYHHGSVDDAATISSPFPITSPRGDDERLQQQHYYSGHECQNLLPTVKQRHFEEEDWKIASRDLVGIKYGIVFFSFTSLSCFCTY